MSSDSIEKDCSTHSAVNGEYEFDQVSVPETGTRVTVDDGEKLATSEFAAEVIERIRSLG
jgi:hypothetical protein